MYFQLPEEARELDKEVRQIIKEKEEAVRNQDFEKVMSLTEDLACRVLLKHEQTLRESPFYQL